MRVVRFEMVGDDDVVTRVVTCPEELVLTGFALR